MFEGHSFPNIENVDFALEKKARFKSFLLLGDLS